MKNTYKGFYPYTAPELSNVWARGFLVLDSSALLRLYRYSPATLKEFKAAVESFPNRFLPHQVGLEFHRNRYRAITQQYSSFDRFTKDYRIKRDELLKGIHDHHFLDSEKYRKDFDKLEQKIRKDVEKQRNRYPDYFSKDTILRWVNKTFAAHIGAQYNPEELLTKIREAETRYSAEIPPGFRDQETKKDVRQYGDYLLWSQILERAKSIKAPIILVIDDVKTDWWTITNPGKKAERLPHPYLVQEAWDLTKQKIVVHTSDDFLREVSKRRRSKVSEQTVKEVSTVREASNPVYSSNAFLSSLAPSLEVVGSSVRSWLASREYLTPFIKASIEAYLASQKQSELFAASLGGMATAYGSVVECPNCHSVYSNSENTCTVCGQPNPNISD
jgi:hypothetical protein